MRKLLRRLDLPPIWTALALIFVLWTNQIWPRSGAVAPIWSFLGLGIIIASFALAFWAIWQFHLKKTPIEPRRKPKTIIKSGPFRYMRNPIYSAMVLLIVGVCIATGTVIGYVAPLVLFVILNERFVKPEEIILQNQFGDEARHYFSETRRW